MTRDIQHVSGEAAGIEHLVAERIAAQPRAWLIEPLGLYRSCGDRRRQHRQHIVVRLAQFAIQRLPSGQFLLAAAMVAQRVRTDGDARAILQHD